MSSESRKVIYAEIPNHHKYEEVWNLQKHLQRKLIKTKRSGITNAPGYLLLCEHNPVFTLGKSGKIEHLKSSQEKLEDENIEFFKVNRGGDITFHGPGQITGYPILDLDQYYNDVHRYVRDLEEIIIKTMAEFGLKGVRQDGYTGVWLADKKGRRKICAIGVHMSRWVTLHGFALNVNTDLDFFKQIIPCGIVETDTSVTSISNELNHEISNGDVKQSIKHYFGQVFGFDYLSV